MGETLVGGLASMISVGSGGNLAVESVYFGYRGIIKRNEVGDSLTCAGEIGRMTYEVVFAFGAGVLGRFNANENVVMCEILHDGSFFCSNRGRGLIFKLDFVVEYFALDE